MAEEGIRTGSIMRLERVKAWFISLRGSESRENSIEKQLLLTLSYVPVTGFPNDPTTHPMERMGYVNVATLHGSMERIGFKCSIDELLLALTRVEEKELIEPCIGDDKILYVRLASKVRAKVDTQTGPAKRTKFQSGGLMFSASHISADCWIANPVI